MSNRIFPNWDQINSMHNPLTEGERALLRFLDDNLPKDNNWRDGNPLEDYNGWLIFSQPFLDGKRPDVVIFNPQVGVTFIEVKDWDLDCYDVEYKYKDEDGKREFAKLFVGTNDERYSVKPPIRQVEYYKEVLIGQLVPSIGENMDNVNKSFGLIKAGVYFHKSTTSRCCSMFFPDGKPDYIPMFGHDSLCAERINEIVPDVKLFTSKFWKTEWNKEILFWLKPPFHSIEQGTTLKLKGNQSKIAEPQKGHFRIRGSAGSGKTQALAYRAAKLASQNMNVLVVTYNITLWHYIKDMIARAPFSFSWGRITFDHFHGFCQAKLNEFEVSWPESDGYDDDFFFKHVVPDAVMVAVDHQAYQRYDAILIDEGQDFEYEWYDMLDSCFLSQREELVVVWDKKQNVYERDLSWLDKRRYRKGLEKFEDYIDLSVSYRLPPIVADMAIGFADTFRLNSDIKLKKNNEQLTLFNENHILWKNIDKSKIIEEVFGVYELLKNKGYSASDTVVLLPNHRLGFDVVNFFKNKRIDVNHVFGLSKEDSKYHKKSFWMGDGRLKMCTIYSFKGWESQNVVIYIPEDQGFRISFDEGEDLSSAGNLDSLIYTAITRTRCNLIVLNNNCRYKSFGSKYSSEWEHKYYQQEVSHREFLADGRNITTDEQHRIAQAMISEMEPVIEQHKRKVMSNMPDSCSTNDAPAYKPTVGETWFKPLDDLTNARVSCWREVDSDDLIRIGLTAIEKSTGKPVMFKFNYSETVWALKVIHVGEEMSVEDYCKRLGRPMADTIIVQKFVLTDEGRKANPNRKAEAFWCYPVALSDSPEE